MCARLYLGPQLTVALRAVAGFPEGILGTELTTKMREQSERFGTRIFTETVERVDFSQRPFKLYTDSTEVFADTVIIATGEHLRHALVHAVCPAAWECGAAVGGAACGAFWRVW